MKGLKNAVTIILGLVGAIVTEILLLIYAFTYRALRELNVLKQIRKFCLKRALVHMSLVFGVLRDLDRRGVVPMSHTKQCNTQDTIHQVYLILESGNY